MSGSIGLFSKYIDKEFFIECQQNDNFVIDTAVKQREGGEIHLWSNTRNRNPNQVWTVDREGHIRNAQVKTAAIYAKNTSDGTRLAVTGPGDNISSHGNLGRWSLNEHGEIVSMANPNQMINVCGAKMENGAKMIVWHKQGEKAKNDKWKIQVLPENLPDIGAFRQFVGLPFCIRSRKDMTLVVSGDAGKNLNLLGDSRDRRSSQVWTVDKYGHLLNFSNQQFKIIVQKMEDYSPIAVLPGDGDPPHSRWFMTAAGEIALQANPNVQLNVLSGKATFGAPVVLADRRRGMADTAHWQIQRP